MNCSIPHTWKGKQALSGQEHLIFKRVSFIIFKIIHTRLCCTSWMDTPVCCESSHKAISEWNAGRTSINCGYMRKKKPVRKATSQESVTNGYLPPWVHCQAAGNTTLSNQLTICNLTVKRKDIPVMLRHIACVTETIPPFTVEHDTRQCQRLWHLPLHLQLSDAWKKNTHTDVLLHSFMY